MATPVIPAETARDLPAFHYGDDSWGRHGARVNCLVHRDYRISPHTHESVEINLVSAGRGRHRVAGQQRAVEAGDLFVIPPGTIHGYADLGGLRVHHLLFNAAFAAEHAARLLLLPGWLLLFTVEPYFRARGAYRHALHLEPADCAQLAARLDEIVEALERTPPDDLGAEGLTLHVISGLCRRYHAEHGAAADPHGPTRAIAAAIAMVEARHGEKLTLADLAAAGDLDGDRFGQLFHATVGVTPMAYLARVRVRAAQRLLLATDRPLTAIALDTGFYDSAHFSRVFTRIAGCGPRAFRLRARR